MIFDYFFVFVVVPVIAVVELVAVLLFVVVGTLPTRLRPWLLFFGGACGERGYFVGGQLEQKKRKSKNLGLSTPAKDENYGTPIVGTLPPRSPPPPCSLTTRRLYLDNNVKSLASSFWDISPRIRMIHCAMSEKTVVRRGQWKKKQKSAAGGMKCRPRF